MPVAAEPDDPAAGRAVLVDTSVAVALALGDHEAHRSTSAHLSDRVLGLAGHAWFETVSVLTRLPPPARRRPVQVAQILAHNFPASRFLDAEDQRRLVVRLAEMQIGGGAVYDALVAAVAERHEMVLATRDQRAVGTYRAFDVELELID
jgi:predicted nucleic acid-binding protein